MKAFPVAMTLMLLTGPASAQAVNLLADKPRQTQDDVLRDKAIEDAYRAKMNQLPDQKASSDPWATVRSTEVPKSAPTPRKPNPK